MRTNQTAGHCPRCLRALWYVLPRGRGRIAIEDTAFVNGTAVHVRCLPAGQTLDLIPIVST